jgi:hypothetical protein
MVKELILAITLGALLGFGLTGTIISLRSHRSPPPPIVTSPIPTDAPNITSSKTPNFAHPSIATSVSPNSSSQLTANTSHHQLQINDPENESIVTSDKINLSGTTSPNSLLIVKIGQNSFTTSADTSGKFAFSNLPLEAGTNIIQAAAFDSQDNSAETQVIITYSSAKI